MTQEQLYKASVASGLKNMSWAELSGAVISTSNTEYADSFSEPRSGFSGVGAYAPIGAPTDASPSYVTPGFQLIPTVGSVCGLNFAEVIQLTEDYYAPGSIGSFNLQVALKVVNHQTEEWPASKWETIIIPMNSSICVSERGTSSLFTALLTNSVER